MADDPIEENTAEESEEKPTTDLQAADEEEQEPAEMPTAAEEAVEEEAPQEVVHVEPKSAAENVSIQTENLDLLMDVALDVTVELGRKEMTFEEILQLSKGALIELTKVADGPVDIYVNRSKIAEGEVVVIDEHFGVRITRILNTERLKRIG